jgi:diguanylate cyclase (GGDEF)-like protein
VEDVTERRKSAESIKWLDQHDALTEVANPMYFGEELENALRQLQLGITFALHWIDLDRFGEINDMFGRPIGDAVLRSVAERLVQSVRKDDLVARLGGDEFAIIQAGVKTQAVAEHLAKRLLRAISEPYHILGHEISISASIGVVLAPKHGTSSLELIKNVYLALYAAKAGGRGTHTMFDEERANVPKRGEAAAVRRGAFRDG